MGASLSSRQPLQEPPHSATKILALTLITNRPRHPGHRDLGRAPRRRAPGPDADLGFPKLRATVAPAPYDAYAATQYRRH